MRRGFNTVGHAWRH